MEETLDQYKKELEQKDREILRLARYALFFSTVFFGRLVECFTFFQMTNFMLCFI